MVIFTAEKLGHHLGALLFLLFVGVWPGLLAHETVQNWYVPLIRRDGVVDGGMMIVLAFELACLLAIVATVAYRIANPRTIAPTHLALAPSTF
jgi:hypothetical protein